MNSNNLIIPNLLEELGKKIQSKEITNNWFKVGEGCIEEGKEKCENGCECEGTEGLTYEDKEFAYILYLETGKFEKLPKEKK